MVMVELMAGVAVVGCGNGINGCSSIAKGFSMNRFSSSISGADDSSCGNSGNDNRGTVVAAVGFVMVITLVLSSRVDDSSASCSCHNSSESIGCNQNGNSNNSTCKSNTKSNTDNRNKT